MTERRVFLAALLSVLFLSLYVQMMSRTPPVTRPVASRSVQTTSAIEKAAPYLISQEDVIEIESPDIRLEIGQTSGAIRRATLKRFTNAKHETLSFSGPIPLVRLQLGSASGDWKLIDKTSSGVTFENNNYHVSYLINQTIPLVNIQLDSKNQYDNTAISLDSAWMKADGLDDRRNPLEVIALHKSSDKRSYKRYLSGSRHERIVPRGTSRLTLSERYFCQSIAPASAAQTTILPSPQGTIVTRSVFHSTGPGPVAAIYFGPRDFFYLKQAGIAEAVPIGMLGQIGLILLVLLSWIASVTHNYGVAIILLSTAVTCATAPFTIMGFRSMKKMQELKPRIDKIMAQHKGDQARANREVFALYKEHKVSPLGGCLPILLQMPIFIALFQAISHFVELRGQRFLWAADLSLPDHLLKLPTHLPILGDYLNALPLIMAAVMYFQTKASQGASGSDQNPMASAFSGPIMPIMFGVMFYQFPAGLVLYWLSNSLLSLLWFRAAKS